MGYSPWGLKELDMTEQLSTHRAKHSNADSLEHLNGYALPAMMGMRRKLLRKVLTNKDAPLLDYPERHQRSGLGHTS